MNRAFMAVCECGCKGPPELSGSIPYHQRIQRLRPILGQDPTWSIRKISRWSVSMYAHREGPILGMGQWQYPPNGTEEPNYHGELPNPYLITPVLKLRHPPPPLEKN